MYKAKLDRPKSYTKIRSIFGWIEFIGFLGIPVSVFFDSFESLYDFLFLIAVGFIVRLSLKLFWPVKQVDSFYPEKAAKLKGSLYFMFYSIPEFKELRNLTTPTNDQAALLAYYTFWNSLFNYLPMRPDILAKRDPKIQNNLKQLTMALSQGLSRHVSQYNDSYNAQANIATITPFVNMLLNQNSYDAFIHGVYRPLTEYVDMNRDPQKSANNIQSPELTNARSVIDLLGFSTLYKNEEHATTVFSTRSIVDATEQMIQNAF